MFVPALRALILRRVRCSDEDATEDVSAPSSRRRRPREAGCEAAAPPPPCGGVRVLPVRGDVHGTRGEHRAPEGGARLVSDPPAATAVRRGARDKGHAPHHGDVRRPADAARRHRRPVGAVGRGPTGAATAARRPTPRPQSEARSVSHGRVGETEEAVRGGTRRGEDGAGGRRGDGGDGGGDGDRGGASGQSVLLRLRASRRARRLCAAQADVRAARADARLCLLRVPPPLLHAPHAARAQEDGARLQRLQLGLLDVLPRLRVARDVRRSPARVLPGRPVGRPARHPDGGQRHQPRHRGEERVWRV